MDTIFRRGGSAVEELRYLRHCPAGGSRHIGLPKPQNAPPALPDQQTLLPIAPDVILDLRDPVGWIRSSAEPLLPLVPIATVPEISIHEDGQSVLPEHDVRSSWKPPHMQAVAQAPSPKGFPEQELRGCVAGPVPALRSGGRLRSRNTSVVAGNGTGSSLFHYILPRPQADGMRPNLRHHPPQNRDKIRRPPVIHHNSIAETAFTLWVGIQIRGGSERELPPFRTCMQAC